MPLPVRCSPGVNRGKRLEAVLCLDSAAYQYGTHSRAEGISAGVEKPIVESQEGLIAVSDEIKCGSMKLNGPRWLRGVWGVSEHSH